MTSTRRQQWPMPEYIEAWKLFRTHSNENEATAEYLTHHPLWSPGPHLTLCDLGCGDGRLLANVLDLDRDKHLDEVRLIDPDDDLLLAATSLITTQFPNR